MTSLQLLAPPNPSPALFSNHPFPIPLPPAASAPPTPSASSARSFPHSLRLMAGQCQWSRSNCDCPRFDSIASSAALSPQVPCDRCLHPLSAHASFPPSANASVPVAPHHPLPSPQPFTPLVVPEDIVPRDDLCANLMRLLLEHHVVHLRGTPASGKTTLLNLFHRHVARTRPQLHVVQLGSWKQDMVWHKQLWQRTVDAGVSLDQRDSWQNDHHRLLARGDLVFLVDEAQGSYHDEDFWNQCIKYLSDSSLLTPRPYVMLFSSYGSPTPGPVVFRDGSAPCQLSPEQRVSLRSSPGCSESAQLFLGRVEYNALVDRMQQNSVKSFRAARDVIEHIFQATDGHAGLVKQVWMSLIASPILRPFTRDTLAPQMFGMETARKFLDNDEALFSALQKSAVARCFPANDFFINNPSYGDLLRRVITEGNVADDLGTNAALRHVYHYGFLHAVLVESDQSNKMGLRGTKTVYVPPTTLHLRYYRHLLVSRELSFPLHDYPHLRTLWTAAIKQFSHNRLLNSRVSERVGAGLKLPAIEAMFQDELYRVLYVILGHEIHVDCEWSGPNSRGQIDFYIASTKWGIECVRENDRLVEHIERFGEKGRYHRWVLDGYITTYSLLNFTTCLPVTKYPNAPFLFHIQFTPTTYDEFRILDHMLEEVEGPYALIR